MLTLMRLVMMIMMFMMMFMTKMSVDDDDDADIDIDDEDVMMLMRLMMQMMLLLMMMFHDVDDEDIMMLLRLMMPTKLMMRMAWCWWGWRWGRGCQDVDEINDGDVIMLMMKPMSENIFRISCLATSLHSQRGLPMFSYFSYVHAWICHDQKGPLPISPLYLRPWRWVCHNNDKFDDVGVEGGMMLNLSVMLMMLMIRMSWC